MKYRKKPVVIEAMQITNSNVSKVLDCMKEICLVCGDDLPPLNGEEENDFSFMCEMCRIDGGRNEAD